MGKSSVITDVRVETPYVPPEKNLVEQMGPTLMLVEGLSRGDGKACWMLAQTEHDITDTPSDSLLFDLPGVGCGKPCSSYGTVTEYRQILYNKFEQRYPLEEPEFRRIVLCTDQYNYRDRLVGKVEVKSTEEARCLTYDSLDSLYNTSRSTLESYLYHVIRLVKKYKQLPCCWNLGSLLRENGLHELAAVDIVLRNDDSLLLYDSEAAKRTRSSITAAAARREKREQQRKLVEKLQKAKGKEAKRAARLAKKNEKKKPPAPLEPYQMCWPAIDMISRVGSEGVQIDHINTSETTATNVVYMWRFGVKWMNLLYGSNAHREIESVWTFIKNVWPVYGKSTKKGWKNQTYGTGDLFEFFDAESKCRRNGRVRPLKDRLDSKLAGLPGVIRNL